REEVVGEKARSVRIAGCDRAGTVGRVDGETDVAAGGFRGACNVGPTVLLHDREPGGVHFAKLDRRETVGAGRQGSVAAALFVYGRFGHDLFAVDYRRDAASLSHLGQATAD